MNAPHLVKTAHQVQATLRPIVVDEDYYFLPLVDPESGEMKNLLFSKHQWQVAEERAAKKGDALPTVPSIPSWKAAVLKVLGFQFI